MVEKHYILLRFESLLQPTKNIFFVAFIQKIRQVSTCRIFLSIAKAMVYHHALACISSRVSVYLITEGAYHQPQAVSSFAVMIYNGKPLVIYNSCGIDDMHASRRDLAASTLVPNKRRQQAAALQKILYMFRKAWYNSINK